MSRKCVNIWKYRYPVRLVGALLIAKMFSSSSENYASAVIQWVLFFYIFITGIWHEIVKLISE
jgi:hypothetical protein